MGPLAHSSFSASASARLLACPGSYALAQAADDGTRRASTFSAEGTLAHGMSEACLHSGKPVADFVGETRTADGFTFEVDADFAEAAQVYVDYVRALKTLGYLVMLETRVSPKHLWLGLPDVGVELFGTADVIAYHPAHQHLAIVDLKFGKGVAVEAQGNPQLLYYAAGAMKFTVLDRLCVGAGKRFEGVKTVSATIVQPRAFHPSGRIRPATYDVNEVVAWARDVLYPGVVKALADGGKTLFAGKQCRFCPVAATCETLKDFSLATAVQAFNAAPPTNTPAAASAYQAPLPAQITLSDEDLGELLGKIATIGPWIDAVKKLASSRLEGGKDVPGWKLVPSLARRKWAADDDQAQMAALSAAGVDLDPITTVALLSPAQAQKVLGKKEYDAALAPFVVKSSSGLTLAPASDPRAAVVRQTAAQAFGFLPE